MTLATWLTFFLACWAISLSPGPGAIAAMSAGLNHGFRRGYFMVFGLILGICTLVGIVVAGLGAIIAASNTAFTVLKFARRGLPRVGRHLAMARERQAVGGRHGRARALSRKQLVVRGWAINATNPKGAVFMAAVVPNFVDPSHPLLPQYLIIMASLSLHRPGGDGGIRGARGASVLRALERAASRASLMNRCFGGLFVVAGTLAGHVPPRHHLRTPMTADTLVILTGASRGLGQAMAAQYLARRRLRAGAVARASRPTSRPAAPRAGWSNGLPTSPTRCRWPSAWPPGSPTSSADAAGRAAQLASA